jgi:hypothetical protein
MPCHPFELFTPKSQCPKRTREVENFITMETTEQVAIPDPEVVPERAHSSKFSGKVLQIFQRTKIRGLNPRQKKIGMEPGHRIIFSSNPHPLPPLVVGLTPSSIRWSLLQSYFQWQDPRLFC